MSELSRNEKFYRFPGAALFVLGIIGEFFLILLGKSLTFPVKISDDGKAADLNIPTFFTICAFTAVFWMLVPTFKKALPHVIPFLKNFLPAFLVKKQ